VNDHEGEDVTLTFVVHIHAAKGSQICPFWTRRRECTARRRPSGIAKRNRQCSSRKEALESAFRERNGGGGRAVGNSRKCIGKDTWRGHEPRAESSRETARFTVRLCASGIVHSFALPPGILSSLCSAAAGLPPLPLQFPMKRALAPGFSRIEGSALVRLKPLVRRVSTLRPCRYHRRVFIYSSAKGYSLSLSLMFVGPLEIRGSLRMYVCLTNARSSAAKLAQAASRVSGRENVW